MKTIVIATSLLGFSLTGCSDEADIGIDSEPITCMPTATGGMSGSADYNGQTYLFPNGSPTLTRDSQTGAITMLSLWSSEIPESQYGNYLRFFFNCGPAEVASYGVVGSNSVACPYQASAAVTGQIEILEATAGTLIVDDNTSCFAGRFRVDLGGQGGNGSVSGWFSVPLP